MKLLKKVILWTIAVLMIAAVVFVLFFQDVLTRYRPVIDPQPIPEYTLLAAETGQSYVHFIAIGDFGKGNWIQRAVGRGMANKAKQDPVEFILALGDNFYWDGVQSVDDERWQSYFADSFLVHPELRIPYYAVLGNHDYLGNPQAQVDYTELSDYWQMPERYFTFTKAINEETDIQFFALDTEMLFYGNGIADEQYQWLEQELSQSDAKWKIVYGHHQAYSNYQGEDVINEPQLVNMMAQYGVDVYLSGHLHAQALFKPVNGVQHIASGSGSSSRIVWTDNIVYAASDYGFTWFRVGEDELVIEFVSTQGLWELLRGAVQTRFGYTINKP